LRVGRRLRRRSRPEASMSRSRSELTAYAGLSSSILAIALVLGAPTPWLGLVGALLLACVPAGAAVMCWIDAGENAAQAGLTVALSLTVLALASAIMIWLAAWQPRELLVLAGAAVISCALRLRAARRAGGPR
jgi:drug/metabolite transporter (DMT)-like permease